MQKGLILMEGSGRVNLLHFLWGSEIATVAESFILVLPLSVKPFLPILIPFCYYYPRIRGSHGSPVLIMRLTS
jgi:hypothetical protein